MLSIIRIIVLIIFGIVSLNLYNYDRYEPLSSILGKEYFLHAYGPIYALSADVVMSLVALRNNRQVGFVQNSVNDLS